MYVLIRDNKRVKNDEQETIINCSSSIEFIGSKKECFKYLRGLELDYLKCEWEFSQYSNVSVMSKQLTNYKVIKSFTIRDRKNNLLKLITE